MGFLKTLLRLLSGPPQKKARAPRKPQAPTPPRLPALVPRDFIELTLAEAQLVCMAVQTMTGDSRMTLKERLIDGMESEAGLALSEIPEGERPLVTSELSWSGEVDFVGLMERVQALTGRQVQAVVSTANRWAKMADTGDWDDDEALVLAGMMKDGA